MISVYEAMQKATQLQRVGQLEQAEMLLKRILATKPTHAEALHLLGLIAYQVNKIALSVQLIEEAIKSNPHVALFHCNLAEMQRQSKALSLSIHHGEQAVALDPHYATAWSNLGIAYYDDKQYEQAKACHQRALAIHPQLSSSLNNMGSIYKALDEIQPAISYYQAAIKASPRYVDPFNNLGALFLQQQQFKQALAYLQQAIVLAPSFANAHCNMGLACLGLGNCHQALLCFEKALQLKPDYAEAYYGIAKVYLHQQLFIESEHYLRQALMINPNEVEFYHFMAKIYQEQGQFAQALMYLDQSLAIDLTSTTSYLSKGNMLMEMGELDKAEAYFLQAAADPCPNHQVLVHYSLVQLRKVSPQHTSLHDLFTLATHPETLSPSQLEYVYFALGKCHDDIGEYAKAFEYFTQGCHVKRTRMPYDIQEQMAFTEQLIHCFTPQTIEHLQAFANPSTVPIFIVGMPRSGSTLVEQILSSHPGIHGAGELKYLHDLIQQPLQHQQPTVHYPENVLQFSSEIAQTITAQYIAYLQRFSAEARHITDKMPHNFIAIGLIHALLPNAKIIHVHRHPIDTCLSCYTQLFTEGHLYSYDLTNLGQYYRCYERIMEHWRHLLPPNAWLDVQYETLVTHVDEEARRLVEFCNLPWDPACLNFYQSMRQVRTASFVQVRQPIYTSSVERWRCYEQELTPLINALK